MYNVEILINCTDSLVLWDLVRFLCGYLSSIAGNGDRASTQVFHFRTDVLERNQLGVIN